MSPFSKLFLVLSLACAICGNAFAAITEALNLRSDAMDKYVPVTLILPEAYRADPDRRFPVLYLLHGAGGTHAGWSANTNIAVIADRDEYIVVCPDGGSTSWYLDSPLDPAYRYETFVAKECVEQIDASYRTINERKGRAIAGLSMGGHGAIYLATRHRSTYSAALSFSGGLDIRPFPNSWDLKRRLGSLETSPQNWLEHTAINIVRDLKDGELALVIDCGDEDFFLGVNRAFHNQLNGQGVHHTYIEAPGKHNWQYWYGCINRHAYFIKEHFKAAR